MKIALCLNGTMRSPNNCLHTLYNNIIKPWDTDVIVCINKCYSDDYERVNKLKQYGANLIEVDIKQQDDPFTVFSDSFYRKLVPFVKKRILLEESFNAFVEWFGFLGPITGRSSSLHIRLNWYKLSNIVKKYVSNYDYFIITRPDHLYLFPLFDKHLLTKKDTIYHYDHHGFNFGSLGGINADFIIVHSSMVLEWLCKHYEYLIKEELQDILIENLSSATHLHSEAYTALITKLCNWKLNQININSFISADSLNEHTSSTPVMYDENCKYFYKYHSNFLPAIDNLHKWDNNNRWKEVNGDFILQK